MKLGLLAAAGLMAAGLASAIVGQQPPAVIGHGPVVVIPIHGVVDDGMDHLVARSIEAAQRDGASAIVLDVNSPGGLLEAAFDIRDAVLNARVPTYAYVSERAYSSAALITLAAQHVYMAPGASIGEAEPAPATSKLISAVKAEFKSTAERNHRDPLIVAAMVDKTIDLPQYKRPGQNLTLDTQDALKTKIADGEYLTFAEMLAANHLSGPQESLPYTFAEQLARFATNPAVSGLLLTLGFLGLLIEMQTLHGIAGVIGVASLALFFGSHIYAGFSNGLVIILAVAGVVGILYELHIVPGHGAPGILGGIALLAAILLAFGIPFFFIAMQTLSTAIVLTVVFFYLATRAFPQNAWFAKLTFAGAQGAEYVTSRDFSDLHGHTGVASSYLRPAGVANINGRRIDVLTQGEFIPAGTPIRVQRVEGARVFVEPVDLPGHKE
ncbi:MAG TPA: NfeD family protein [Candidatus Rubrimentiphilum sp.]|nr:NfeD family protein [Candidatus Rubrimentiphilum sp.]